MSINTVITNIVIKYLLKYNMGWLNSPLVSAKAALKCNLFSLYYHQNGIWLTGIFLNGPSPDSFLSFYKQILHFLQQLNATKCPFSIRTKNLQSMSFLPLPLDQGSRPTNVNIYLANFFVNYHSRLFSKWSFYASSKRSVVVAYLAERSPSMQEVRSSNPVIAKV